MLAPSLSAISGGVDRSARARTTPPCRPRPGPPPREPSARRGPSVTVSDQARCGSAAAAGLLGLMAGGTAATPRGEGGDVDGWGSVGGAAAPRAQQWPQDDLGGPGARSPPPPPPPTP